MFLVCPVGFMRISLAKIRIVCQNPKFFSGVAFTSFLVARRRLCLINIPSNHPKYEVLPSVRFIPHKKLIHHIRFIDYHLTHTYLHFLNQFARVKVRQNFTPYLVIHVNRIGNALAYGRSSTDSLIRFIFYWIDRICIATNKSTY